MTDPTLRVKNWREFQHYTDRRPPWIKLHVSLLDNYEFQCLPLASRALAPMLWLLASENVDGTIPADPGLLAFRLRWDVKELKAGLTPLIDKGFLIDASNALAERLQSAPSETETETETEGALAPPEGLNPEAWERFVGYRKAIKKAIRKASVPLAQRSLAAFGSDQMAVVEQSIANGWQGLFPLRTANNKPAQPKYDPYKGCVNR
jgi:hypothetical protein